MAQNERIEYNLSDLPYEQSAPSQSGRTNFTPGKANGRPDDMNWPLQYLAPVGVPAIEAAGPVPMQRKRSVKLGRNIVSDQVLPLPKVTKMVTTIVTDPSVWGSVSPEHTVTETVLQEAAVVERTDGYDWADV